MPKPLKKAPNLETVTTINDDGSHYVLHPADVRGKFTWMRRAVAAAMLFVYVALPWIPINGNPAVFLDVAQRRFHLFGLTLAPQDLWVLFFLISGLGFTLFFITSLLGRLWCGWACPYTIFLEHIFRRIERLIDGDAPARRKLAAAPWTFEKVRKRVLKHGIYLLSAALLAHIFLSYFVSLKSLYGFMHESPLAHFTPFAIATFLTVVLYGCFAFFREQFCIIMCPYGRIQSVLTDDDTMIIGYDESRGEPRGAKGQAEGDCIDCRRCVNVCPTGIDIRNGLQIECIGCSACVDACDEIMEKVDRPKGLVRYDSMNGLEGKQRRIWRPRIILYLILSALGTTALVGTVLQRARPYTWSVTRMAGPPHYTDGSSVRNHYEVSLINKRNQPATVTFDLVSPPPGFNLSGAGKTLTVAPKAELNRPAIIVCDYAHYQGPVEVKLLPTGQPLPVTGLLQERDASLSLAWINGEPEPRHFQAGQRIPSGAANLTNQSLTLIADEDFADSLVAKLTQSSDRTQSSALLQKLLKIYLALVLVIGLGGGIAWLLTTGNPVDALQVAISIFIVSCPCALGVAIPLVDRRAATHLQTFGVFVQNTNLWQRLIQIKALVLDKTGTLTLEHPTLQNPELLDSLLPADRHALHLLTASSLHPLSRTLHATVASDSVRPASLTKSAQSASPNPSSGEEVIEISEVAGQGLAATIAGDRYHLGKPQTKTPPSPAPESSDSPSLAPASGPTTTLTRNGETLATFHFREAARPDAARSLSASRVPVHILSGDATARVKGLARSLQLNPTLAHGDLSPDDKAEHIADLNPALFLGDGANDSLAFDRALATGSPVADRSLLDTKADFLFTQPGLGFLPHLLITAHWRHRIVRRVLVFAILYNSAAITLCLSGDMNPLLAAILMPLSSLASLLIASAPMASSPVQFPRTCRDDEIFLPLSSAL